MKTSDLYVGQKVRVIYWEEEMGEDDDPYDYRPEHWCEDGDMDDWQDNVVTVANINESSDSVVIEEDGHKWQWYPWDFHPHCILPKEDPNIVYKATAYRKKMDAMRAKWKTDANGKKYGGTITGRLKLKERY